jgi:hypothetical protein
MRISIFRSGRAVSRAAVLAVAVVAAPASSLVAQTAQAPAAPAAKAADLPSARAILDRHLEAAGGRNAIAKHTSSHLVGTISIPASGITGPFEVFAAKPNMNLTKITIADIGDVIEAYDGKVAWSISPMTGPRLSEGKELEQKKFDAEFYAELRDDSRYESMRTLEKTTFDGRPCYKVSLVKKGTTDEDIEYYDVATGLKAGGTTSRETPMGKITATQIQTDYKKFGDLLQPSTLKVQAMGVDQVITVTAIEYDKVDAAVFDPPAAIKALIK